MKNSLRKFVLAAFCLLSLPAATFAGGVAIDSCGNATVVGNAGNPMVVCALAGGGTAQYNFRAISGLNGFANIHSPVTVTSFAGQVNNFTMTVSSFPVWIGVGAVPTILAMSGTVTLGAGSMVDITFTGTLGGPAQQIAFNFANPGAGVMVVPFTSNLFGGQAISDVATSELVVTITGAATVFFPGSAEFQAEVPEPATLFLLGTGLTGVAMKLRKRRKNKSAT